MYTSLRNAKGIFLAALVAFASHAQAAGIGPHDLADIRALFDRQVAAESAHDIAAMDSLLLKVAKGQPDPVMFIARAYQFHGRDAVMAHFAKSFEGTWRIEPDEAAIRIAPLGADVAQIYAPSQVTLGAAGQPPKTAPFLINEFAIRTLQGWRISAILPVPAQ